MQVLLVMQQQPKLMAHYGHGERIVLETQDKIIMQIIHHQLKYLELLGILRNLRLDIIKHLQPKLMAHYGHGDIILGDTLHKIIQHIVHHQSKYLVLHGVMYSLMIFVVDLELKLMEHFGHGVETNLDNQHRIIQHQFHRQLKYLVLIGIGLVLVELVVFLWVNEYRPLL